MRAFPFLVLSLVSGSLLAVLVPQRSEPPRRPGPQATPESPAERIGSGRLAGGAKSPAGTGSARDGFFDQLSTTQQADAIRRLNARLQGPPTPSDLRVVFQILAPLDWATSAQLWRELSEETKDAKPLHPELLLVVAEHLAKKDPKATLALAGESKNGPEPERSGLLQLLHAAFGVLLHRDAAEAARTLAKLPPGLSETSLQEGGNNRRLDFTKIGGTFASVLQVVEENPQVLLKHEFTRNVLASLAYEETHSLPAVIKKLRATAHYLARTFPDHLKLAGQDDTRNLAGRLVFESQFISEGVGHLTQTLPIPLDPSEVPEQDKDPAGILMALKAFRIGLSEDVDSVMAFLEKQSQEGSDDSLKIGAFAGAMIRDAPAILRALENTSSLTLKQEFFEAAPIAHALLMNGAEDGSVSTADTITIASDLQLPVPLAAEFFAYQLGRQEKFLDFSAPQKSSLPHGMFIESLPLPEPQKQELHRRYHAISLEK